MTTRRSEIKIRKKGGKGRKCWKKNEERKIVLVVGKKGECIRRGR